MVAPPTPARPARRTARYRLSSCPSAPVGPRPRLAAWSHLDLLNGDGLRRAHLHAGHAARAFGGVTAHESCLFRVLCRVWRREVSRSRAQGQDLDGTVVHAVALSLACFPL